MTGKVGVQSSEGARYCLESTFVTCYETDKRTDLSILFLRFFLWP